MRTKKAKFLKNIYRFKRDRQIKRLETTWIIIKISEKFYRKQIKKKKQVQYLIK